MVSWLCPDARIHLPFHKKEQAAVRGFPGDISRPSGRWSEHATLFGCYFAGLQGGFFAGTAKASCLPAAYNSGNNHDVPANSHEYFSVRVRQGRIAWPCKATHNAPGMDRAWAYNNCGNCYRIPDPITEKDCG